MNGLLHMNSKLNSGNAVCCVVVFDKARTGKHHKAKEALRVGAKPGQMLHKMIGQGRLGQMRAGQCQTGQAVMPMR